MPAPVVDGRAPVGTANTAWNPESGRLEVAFAFPDKPRGRWRLPARSRPTRSSAITRRPAAPPATTATSTTTATAATPSSTRRLNPQLARTAYDPAARAADLDYGLNDRILFDRPTLGNSSTALTGEPFWRSLPRQAMTQGDGAGPFRLWQTAAANHLYVYPAHMDFTDKDGDLFPANTPYILVSRGSSGSDRPFLEAVGPYPRRPPPRHQGEGGRGRTCWCPRCR